MTKSLRVIIADDEPLLVEELSVCLGDMGGEVVATAASGEELVAKCADLSPDLIITDIKMPDMDGLVAAKKIFDHQPVPVIIVSAYHNQEFIDQALEQCVMAYLVKPIDDATLKTTVALARRRFQEFEALHKANADLQQTLDDRKIIERAKGVLMKRSGLDESAAFHRLQKVAREKATRVVDIAASILAAEEAYDV